MDSPDPGIDSDVLTAEFDRLTESIEPIFARPGARRRARGYLRGLLSDIPRKNSWQLAEQVGDATPDGIQNLLGRASWSADSLRDHLRNYAVDRLGGTEATLILDETGFLKKGTRSAGVARQYSGTAGRIENSQIGVFLAYRTSRGCVLIDRELYLPEAWIDDPDRCRAAGVPEDRTFQTKVELARVMLTRATEAGLPFSWVTGDEVYSSWALRRQLEDAEKNYVLAINRTLKIRHGFSQKTAESIAENLSGAKWRTISVGSGSKGQRRSRWCRIEVNHDLGPARKRWLVIRESLSETREQSFYLASGPARTTLTKLAEVAGSRWSIEIAFEEAKGQVGLDEYEVRSFEGWQRHITFSMLAYALLVVLRSETAARSGSETSGSEKKRTSSR